MEINNWIDFLISSVFTIGVLFIGLPLGVKLSYHSIKRLTLKGNTPYSKNTIIKHFGKTPIQTLFVGLFGFVVSIWYLLFDRGGALVMFYANASSFLLS